MFGLAFWQPFADQLPEELFLQVASYLSQRDLIRAAQVNQRWRNVLHGHPHLWTTMNLHILKPASSSSKDAEYQFRLVANQMAFYGERLPEYGPRQLENLSLHGDLKPDGLPPNSPLSRLLDGQHRFGNQISNLAVFGTAARQWLLKIVPSQFGIDSAQRLRCIRIPLAKNDFAVTSFGPPAYLERFPNLLTLEMLSDLDVSAESQLGRPLTAASCGNVMSCAKTLGSPLERLVVQGNIALSTSSRQGSPDEEDIDYSNLQHLEIGRVSLSYFFNHSPMLQLRTLCLTNALFNPSFVLPKNTDGDRATTGRSLNPFLNAPLDLPLLETFKLICSDERTDSGTRNVVRPAIYLCRLKAPKLRHLTIKNFGAVLPVTPSMHNKEKRAWMNFCENHPNLEELVLPKTTIVDLTESLPYLPNLQKLLLSTVDLSSSFLKSATSPSLPHLKQITVSHCSNITSGDLLRLVQSKNGNIDYLDIEGCTDLQKEAVDWLKANVKQVKWSGWGNKNEKRSFGFRS